MQLKAPYALLLLRKLLKARLFIVLGLVFFGQIAAPSRAHAACTCQCVSVVATLQIFEPALIQMANAWWQLFNSTWQTTVTTYTNAVGSIASAVNALSTTQVSSSQMLADSVNRAKSGALRAVTTSDGAIGTRPSHSVCLALVNKADSSGATDFSRALNNTTTQQNVAMLTGNSPITAGGEVAAGAGQFQRIVSNYFDPAIWTCPAGMTCAAAPDPLGGTMARKNLNPVDLIFGRQRIEQGTIREDASRLWADLVVAPTPPNHPKGDELATPSGRSDLIATRSYYAALAIQHYAVTDSINDRIGRVATAMLPEQKSEMEQFYNTAASQVEMLARYAADSKGTDKSSVMLLSAEADKLNTIYWDLLEELEKIALLKATKMKLLFDESASEIGPSIATGGV
jgi:hypothetical protein